MTRQVTLDRTFCWKEMLQGAITGRGTSGMARCPEAQGCPAVGKGTPFFHRNTAQDLWLGIYPERRSLRTSKVTLQRKCQSQWDTTCEVSTPGLGADPQDWDQGLYVNILGSTIHNSQSTKTTRGSGNSQMDKPNVAGPKKGILFGHKGNETLTPATVWWNPEDMMLRERSQTQGPSTL